MSALCVGLHTKLLKCGGDLLHGIIESYYTLASLEAQMVKNPPAMWETWVWSLGWEDALEEVMENHSSILAWRIPVDRGAWRATVHRVSKSRTWLKWLSTAHNRKLWLWNERNQLRVLLLSLTESSGKLFGCSDPQIHVLKWHVLWIWQGCFMDMAKCLMGTKNYHH